MSGEPAIPSDIRHDWSREEIATLEDERDGACLDRCRMLVALFGDGPEEIGRQAERVKCQE